MYASKVNFIQQNATTRTPTGQKALHQPNFIRMHNRIQIRNEQTQGNHTHGHNEHFFCKLPLFQAHTHTQTSKSLSETHSHAQPYGRYQFSQEKIH